MQNLQSVLRSVSELGLQDQVALMRQVFPTIEPANRGSVLAGILGELDTQERGNTLVGAMDDLPITERVATVKAVAQQLPDADKRSLAQLVLPPPRDTKSLYLIVIIAFSAVLVGSCATIALATFIKPHESARPELVLTMFTSVVGFLAGLFVPSPANSGSK